MSRVSSSLKEIEMSNLIKTVSLAIAAGGLGLAVPAAAATPLAPQSSQIQFGASQDIAGSMIFEQGRDRYDRRRDRRYYGNRYERRSDYRRNSRDRRVWRGRDNRYYCQKDDGTTGLLIGGAAGALLGNEVAGRGDRTIGAIVGGAAGALLGRSIDRSGSRCE